VCVCVCVMGCVIVNNRQIKLVFHSTRANDLYSILLLLLLWYVYLYNMTSDNARHLYADVAESRVAMMTDVWQVFTGARVIMRAKYFWEKTEIFFLLNPVTSFMTWGSAAVRTANRIHFPSPRHFYKYLFQTRMVNLIDCWQFMVQYLAIFITFVAAALSTMVYFWLFFGVGGVLTTPDNDLFFLYKYYHSLICNNILNSIFKYFVNSSFVW